MTNAQLAAHLVELLQTHRDALSDTAWDKLDQTPLGDVLDTITELEWQIEDNGHIVRS